MRGKVLIGDALRLMNLSSEKLIKMSGTSLMKPLSFLIMGSIRLRSLRVRLSGLQEMVNLRFLTQLVRTESIFTLLTNGIGLAVELVGHLRQVFRRWFSTIQVVFLRQIQAFNTYLILLSLLGQGLKLFSIQTAEQIHIWSIRFLIPI